MLVSADTLRGRRRENQDHVLAGNLLLSGGLSLHAAAPPEEPVLLAVSDGIGGGVFPREASKTALEAFQAAFWCAEGTFPPLLPRLLQAAQAANQSVWQLCGSNGGCTLTCAAVMPDGSFATLGLGDSPIWLLTAGGLRRLFTPQNEAELKKEQGLRPVHGDKCALLAFCGMNPNPARLPFRITSCGRLHPGEGLLLHSDGLTLTPSALRRGMQTKTPAKALCRKALLRGSRDNISAVYALMDKT